MSNAKWYVWAVLPLLAAVLPARADLITGTLNASLDTGSLSGTMFPVTFSYDSNDVNPVGESFATLQSFDFVLLGAQFTRDDIFKGGQAIFEDGVIDNVTASFQVRLPPNSPVKNITFGFGEARGIAYIDLNDQSGSGSFTFGSSVPESSSLPLFALGFFLLVATHAAGWSPGPERSRHLKPPRQWRTLGNDVLCECVSTSEGKR